MYFKRIGHKSHIFFTQFGVRQYHEIECLVLFLHNFLKHIVQIWCKKLKVQNWYKMNITLLLVTNSIVGQNL